jgi:hypothetical protein
MWSCRNRWEKAVEGHRSPKREAFAYDLRIARQRLGVRQPSGAFVREQTPVK